MTDVYLSPQQCENVIKDVITGFEEELSRIQNTAILERIVSNVLQIHYDQPLFTFFTPMVLKDIASDIFHDAILRNFILNLSERIALKWINNGVDYNDILINTYVRAISINKPPFSESSNCLINKEVISSIEIVPDVLKALLKDNMWLLILYLLIVNLHMSGFIATLKTASNKT